jgi:hypothetical protein
MPHALTLRQSAKNFQTPNSSFSEGNASGKAIRPGTITSFIDYHSQSRQWSFHALAIPSRHHGCSFFTAWEQRASSAS